MRSGLGILIDGAGWIGLLLGFVQGSLAPALVGFALLSLSLAAQRSISGASVTAHRDLPHTTHVGARVRSRLRVRTEPAVPVRVQDEPPAVARVVSVDAPAGLGESYADTVVELREPGSVAWTGAVATVADPWGLAARRVRLRAEARLEVSPEPAWISRGRQVGRRHTAETLTASRFALEPSVDIERVRPFLPGDRVRDVDWARTARLGVLHSRERQRVGPRPVLVVVDATSSMRWRRRTAKISTASRLAAAVVSAATAAGVRATVVSYDEHGVHGNLVATGGSIPESLRRLAGTSSPVTVLDLPELPPDVPVSPAERDFLEALRPFVSGAAPSMPPLEAALAMVTRGNVGPALVVAILDVETNARAAQVAARRLAGSGHRVVVVAPATGAHHYARGEVDRTVLRSLVDARIRRERTRRALFAHGIPLLTLRPGREIDIVEEVAKWAR